MVITPKTYAKIRPGPFLINEATSFVFERSHGAVDIFVGKIRSPNLEKKVLSVTYDAHEAHTEEVFLKICTSVRMACGQNLNLYLAHAKGDVKVGDTSLIVAVSAEHRREAFVACHRIVEEVKHMAPIWKKEYYEDGSSEWIMGHELCRH